MDVQLADGVYGTTPSHNNFAHVGSIYAPSFWSGTRPVTSYTSLRSTATNCKEMPKTNVNDEVSEDVTLLQGGSNGGNDENDANNGSPDTGEQNSQKQSQVASTLNWLADNYERADGVCLPRCVLYTHYLDFCKKQHFTPAGAATFGKIIRQRFPKLTTRRLGTRGQSKYHYYGIGIKESSIYYHSVYSGKGLTRFSGVKIKTEGSNRKYSLSSKTGTLLPEFPDANNLILPETMDKEKLETFIMMYRTHCQRILDSVISANFDEVQNFLLHFWQGMPGHLVTLMGASLVTDLVGLCDSILYKVLIDVLVPSTIQDVPDSLSSEIKGFTRRLPTWLDNALETVPSSLRVKKMEVVRWFIKTIRRQISFVHLAQTARAVLLNHDSVNQMVQDISAVDFNGLCCQAGFTQQQYTSSQRKLVLQYFGEFQTMLNKQAPIEAYTEWLDNMVDRCVLQSCDDVNQSFQRRAAEFLLQWAVYNSLIMRDLTLLSASSFGSFHLIHMMFDEYVFLVMETQLNQIRESELQKAVQRQMKLAGEISMEPKVRTQATKFQSSPKSRKRKSDENCGSDGENEHAAPDESHIRADDSRPCLETNGTAFSRPLALTHRENHTSAFLEDTDRGILHSNTVHHSPIKPMSSINTGCHERGSYLPSFSFNSYTEFVTPGTSFTAPRVPALTDTHHVHSQGFGSMSLNGAMPASAGSYWTDNRHNPSFGDPYTSYSYNKFSPTYESYNKSSLLRNGAYSDAFNRSAFEATRGYYGRAHDSFQVNAPLSVGGYGANFMDIAPSSGQYGRQDSVLFQEDGFPNNIGALSAFNKSYLTATFR